VTKLRHSSSLPGKKSLVSGTVWWWGVSFNYRDVEASAI